MLEVICGTKNIQKILLFLFVNGRCYGTQLSRLMGGSLTPVQKALLRLEKGGLVLSHFEGKTRIYQFNPAYPLLAELEHLLKKAYTLLPPQEKKTFYIAKEEETDGANRTEVLLAFWEKLKDVSRLSFRARTRSKEDSGWNGNGKGEVVVSKEGAVLIFSEKGSWRGREGKEIGFSNVFRWTLDRAAGMISLEHLRRGPDSPVFLFHLAPSGRQALSSVDTHLCADDTYFGRIFFDRNTLRLSWRVIGPKKNEEIDYYYS